MAFGIGEALGIGGSLLGGLLNAKGGNRAAEISAQGSAAALAENRRQFDLSMLMNLLMNQPAINTGNSARSTLAGLLGLNVPGTNFRSAAKMFDGENSDIAGVLRGFKSPGSAAVRPNRINRILQNTPGYQFAVDEATDNIMANNRALGLGKSGASIRSIGDTVGQGIAFPAYQSYLDRLAGLAGAGSGTSANLASNIGSLATNSGALNANLIQNNADSRASGVANQYGAYNGALNQLGAIAGNYFGKRNNGQISSMDILRQQGVF